MAFRRFDTHRLPAVVTRPRLGLVIAWVLALVVASGAPARAAGPPAIAVFGFDLDNTSPAASTPEELARTARMGDALRAALTRSGKYRVVDVSADAARLARLPTIRDCAKCELPMAQAAGAQLAAFGWVQKVSNLILNMNLVIEDVATGKQQAGGSVDIRGNTDETWDRGLKFLLEEHVFGN